MIIYLRMMIIAFQKLKVGGKEKEFNDVISEFRIERKEKNYDIGFRRKI
jgi:hypothetical protein